MTIQWITELGLKLCFSGLQGKLPDYNEPVVLPRSRASIEDFCNKIHRMMIKNFKNANVWGASVKHRPQKVGREHLLQDEDIVSIIKRV